MLGGMFEWVVLEEIGSKKIQENELGDPTVAKARLRSALHENLQGLKNNMTRDIFRRRDTAWDRFLREKFKPHSLKGAHAVEIPLKAKISSGLCAVKKTQR